jgi:hypothetical protein
VWISQIRVCFSFLYMVREFPIWIHVTLILLRVLEIRMVRNYCTHSTIPPYAYLGNQIYKDCFGIAISKFMQWSFSRLWSRLYFAVICQKRLHQYLPHAVDSVMLLALLGKY